MKFLLLGFISLFFHSHSSAEIEDEYKKQQGIRNCNYENAEYYSLDSLEKYCIVGGYWKALDSDDYINSEGFVDRSSKEVDYADRYIIKKYKLEGQDFILYSCEGIANLNNFNCIGSINKVIKASKGKKGAIAQMNYSFDITRDKSEAYLNRAEAKYEIKDYKGAISDIKNSIKLDPTSKYAYSKLGDFYRAAGKINESIQTYTDLIKLNFNDDEKSLASITYLSRALAKRDIGDWEGFCRDARIASELNENFMESFKEIKYCDRFK